jgi:hypothetical protein
LNDINGDAAKTTQTTKVRIQVASCARLIGGMNLNTTTAFCSQLYRGLMAALKRFHSGVDASFAQPL